MGALAQLQAQKATFKAGSPLDRWITSELARLAADEAVPTAAAATDSVFTIAQDAVNHTGGDFTLTATIRQSDGSEETFTTGAAAYNASAATIEGLIDTAATAASITSWTNADISVAGGNLQTAAITITCDGTSVAGRKVTWSMADSRTGGTSGANTQTTEGQFERAALAVLINYGIVSSGTIAGQGDAASASGFAAGATSNRCPAPVVKALMKEAAYEDANNGTYFSLEAVLYPGDNAPAVVPVKTSEADIHDV